MKYYVLNEGLIVGETEIHPTVERIARRDKILLGLNWEASEPRWEAFGAFGMACSGDPNTAVLDCAAQRLDYDMVRR